MRTRAFDDAPLHSSARDASSTSTSRPTSAADHDLDAVYNEKRARARGVARGLGVYHIWRVTSRSARRAHRREVCGWRRTSLLRRETRFVQPLCTRQREAILVHTLVMHRTDVAARAAHRRDGRGHHLAAAAPRSPTTGSRVRGRQRRRFEDAGADGGRENAGADGARDGVPAGAAQPERRDGDARPAAPSRTSFRCPRSTPPRWRSSRRTSRRRTLPARPAARP